VALGSEQFNCQDLACVDARLLLLPSCCRSPRTLVFCNKIETCRVVENALKRRDDSYQVGGVLVSRPGRNMQLFRCVAWLLP
jgi:hypothetical protein